MDRTSTAVDRMSVPRATQNLQSFPGTIIATLTLNYSNNKKRYFEDIRSDIFGIDRSFSRSISATMEITPTLKGTTTQSVVNATSIVFSGKQKHNTTNNTNGHNPATITPKVRCVV